MSELSISEINVTPVKNKEGLVAFASVVINNQLYLGNLAVYSCPSSSDGFRLVYPSKMLNNGTKLPIVYPINKTTGLAIQKQIVERYLKLIEDLTKGDYQNEPKPVSP